jgi:hypothetical protein
VREDHRLPTRIVVDDLSNPLTTSAPSGVSAAYRSSRATRGARWRIVLGAAAILYCAFTLWARADAARTPNPTGASWTVDISSAGKDPVTALAFGPEAGLHLVQVPSENATLDERRRFSARIGAGKVYLMSLGWSELDVHTASPPGVPRMAFWAQSRFVQIFPVGSGVGIRTWWK